MSDSTMKSVGQLTNIERLYRGETKQGPQSRLSPEKAKLIQNGLEKLVNYGLLSDPSAIRDWANGLVDISEHDLVEGFRKAKDKTGYMQLGDFRALCRPEVKVPAHRHYLPTPSKKTLTYDEIHPRLVKMLKELQP